MGRVHQITIALQLFLGSKRCPAIVTWFVWYGSGRLMMMINIEMMITIIEIMMMLMMMKILNHILLLGPSECFRSFTTWWSWSLGWSSSSSQSWPPTRHPPTPKSNLFHLGFLLMSSSSSLISLMLGTQTDVLCQRGQISQLSSVHGFRKKIWTF